MPLLATTTDRVAYAPTFYPGTTNAEEAERLTIAAGQTVAGANLTVVPMTTSSISGTLVDTSGNPLAGSFVSAMPKSPSDGVSVRPVPTRSDGHFTIDGLLPGSYVVRAGTPTASEIAVADVTVAGSDVTGIQLAMTRTSTIRGRVVFTPTDTPSDLPNPASMNVAAVRDWVLGQPVRFPARIKDDGTFEISLMASRVQLRAATVGGRVTGASPWRLNRVMLQGLDVGDAGLDVPPSAVVDNIVVEMTNRSYQLTGRVTDARGKAVVDCLVILFAQDPEHWSVESRYIGLARPGADDRYRMQLLPGDYYAVAMNDVESNAWTDREFLRLAREHATKITIGGDRMHTLDLTLSPAPEL